MFPENLADLAAEELSTLIDTALDRYNELKAIPDAEITDEQIEELESLATGIASVRAEQTTREEAAAARAERIAAARSAVEVVDEDEGDDEPEAAADEVVEEEKEEALVAATPPRTVLKRAAQTLGRKVDEPADEEPKEDPNTAKLFAAADVRGFNSGQQLDGMEQAVEAIQARFKSFPKVRTGNRIEKYGAVIIQRPKSAFAIRGVDAESDMQVMMEAARESRLQGGSLVAAGGWCAPSTNLYGLTSWETVSGILDLPTVDVERGGINFTQGPDFGTDIYDNADFWFEQTEAEAEAGEEKPFLSVECPDFEDVRLSAVGFGIKAGILTNHAYPELIRRYVEGGLVGHAHKVNASVINKVLGYLGSATNFAELGSATADLLHAIEVAVMSIRYKYRLLPTDTVEGFLPVWAKAAIRADLATRNGVAQTNVSDAEIDAHFATRGVRMQYVYDWAGQDLAGDAAALPNSVQFAVYKAGTFVKGSDPVITLDAMYDSTEIKTNTYTALFAEESLLVANMYGQGRRFEVGLNYRGATGFPAVGAGEGVTFAGA